MADFFCFTEGRAMLLFTDFISCCGNVRILEKSQSGISVSCRPISENCAQNGPHTTNSMVRMERSLRQLVLQRIAEQNNVGRRLRSEVLQRPRQPARCTGP